MTTPAVARCHKFQLAFVIRPCHSLGACIWAAAAASFSAATDCLFPSKFEE